MKKLFATTATAMLLGTGAFADAHMAAGVGDLQVDAADFFASDVIGSRVYASEREIERDGGVFNMDDGWDDIGEINDLIVSAEGEVPAALIGVGGFLGIGEKDVAISMDQIAVYTDEGGERFFVTTATADILENAPQFEMDLDGDDVAMTDETMTDETMAEDTAAVEGDAMAADTEATDTEMAEAEATDAEATDTEMAEAEATDAEATETAEAEMAEGEDATAQEAMADTEMDADADMFADYTAVELEGLTTEQLTGARVYDADQNDIGEIDTLLTTGDGMITEAVVDVGGFLGMGEKPVALSFDNLEIMQDAEGEDFVVMINATQEELEAMPTYEE